LTQPALNIIDQRFSRCANKIAVVVPLSEIIDLEFDDSEDGDEREGEEEVDEVDAPVGPNTSSNSKAAKKAKAPQTASSHQIKRELPVFKPNLHKLNDPGVRFSISRLTAAKRAEGPFYSVTDVTKQLCHGCVFRKRAQAADASDASTLNRDVR
jgi:hypothetical protein